jgi:hypothetical protein
MTKRTRRTRALAFKRKVAPSKKTLADWRSNMMHTRTRSPSGRDI